MRKKVIILIILTLIGGGVYYHQTRPAPDAAAGDLTLYGNVDIREVSLGFRVAGRLAALKVDEGDRVVRGQLLAGLDDDRLKSELAVSRAQVEEIQANLQNAEKNYHRLAALVRKGSAPVRDFDDAEALRDQLAARLKTAGAQAALAETSFRDASLLAPADGVVVTRIREPGSILAVGAPVFTLALDEPVWVRTYISEPLLGLIHPGLKVLVLTDSGGRYEGRVGHISPQAEFTPKTVETAELRADLVYRLRVVVTNPDQGLRQGMPVTVRVERSEARP